MVKTEAEQLANSSIKRARTQPTEPAPPVMRGVILGGGGAPGARKLVDIIGPSSHPVVNPGVEGSLRGALEAIATVPFEEAVCLFSKLHEIVNDHKSVAVAICYEAAERATNNMTPQEQADSREYQACKAITAAISRRVHLENIEHARICRIAR